MVIGFFAPFPLVMMMPFMAAQSMLMGDAFGKAYQYGKRKISAMSNEEFNRMSSKDLSNEILTDYTNIIPTMKIAISRSSEFQSFIIEELAKIIKALPADISQGLTGSSGGNPLLENNPQSSGSLYDNINKLIANLLASLNNPVPEAYPTPGKSGSTIAEDEASKDEKTKEDIPVKDTIDAKKEESYAVSYQYFQYVWNPKTKSEHRKRMLYLDKFGTKAQRLRLLTHLEDKLKAASMKLTLMSSKEKVAHRSGKLHHNDSYHAAVAAHKTAFSQQQEYRKELRRMGLYK